MVHLARKKVKGHTYLILQENQRVNGKVVHVWQQYLGPEEEIKENAALVKKPDFEVATYAYGLPAALMQVVAKLDLVQAINRRVGKRQQGLSVGEYVTIAALNRCIEPLSKNQLHEWVKTTCLGDYFQFTDTAISSMAYSNHFNYLTPENLAQVQRDLNEHLRGAFGVSMDQLVYDLTNFYSYVNPGEGEDLPRHGHSKDHRATLNLVGLSLLCSQDGGVPLFYDVYPGNKQDAAVFKEELPRVLQTATDAGVAPSEVVVTFDKGNNSPDAFEVLDNAGLCFVCSVRPSMVKDLAELSGPEFPKFTLPNGKVVHVLELSREFYGQERRLLVVFNPEQAKWNGENLRRKVEKEVAAIQDYFKARLNRKKWRSLDAVRKKVDSMLSPARAPWVGVRLEEEGGEIALELQVKDADLAAHVDTLGKSYLITNHPTLPAVDAAWLFRRQATIERVFSYLKSPDLVRARPMYHRTDACIRGHIFTCVLGLLLLTLLAREVQKQAPELSLYKIVDALDSIKLVTLTFPGSTKVVKKLTLPTPEAKQLCHALNLEIAP